MIVITYQEVEFNSYSGFALCAEGFMLDNTMLTIVGSLVGSFGAILSYKMCKAMNRSLYNVIIGKSTAAVASAKRKKGVHVETTVDSVTELIVQRKNIIITGYGLAVAKAQYSITDITNFLKEHGIKYQRRHSPRCW